MKITVVAAAAAMRNSSCCMVSRVSASSAANGSSINRIAGSIASARALTIAPAILLMDEPFAALDALTRETMQHELLRIAATAGTTVIFITHQIEEAVFLGDRVAVFTARPGRLQEIIPVALPRPRPAGIKQTAEFQSHVGRIARLIGTYESHT